VLIAISNFFDINGSATDYYKIRFYDSVALTYSEYSDPLLGVSDINLTGQATNDILSRTITGINILNTLGAIGPDSSGLYLLFGMKVHQNTAEAITRQCYDYCTDLIGESAMVMTDSSSIRKINGFVSNYAALRILAILAGVSITTHFNYTSGGLNIQKPAVSQIAALLAHYSWETRRRQKILLTRGIVGIQVDLQMDMLNEASPIGSGIQKITFDFPSI
jgi:hypothetical protein